MPRVTYYESKIMVGEVTILSQARAAGISLAGCPWRGTPACSRCPLALKIAAECHYRCSRFVNGSATRTIECEHRLGCPCGWDQSRNLWTWGVVK